MKGFYRYPLHNEDDYQGRMVFQVVNEAAERVTSIDYGGVGTSVVNAFGDTVATVGQAGVSILGSAGNAAANFLGFDTETSPLVFNRKNGEYKGNSRELSILPDRKVTLYLPQAIQIQDAVQYDNNVELGAIGGGIANSARGNLSLANAIDKASQTANNTIKALASGGVSSITQEQASIASQAALKNAGARGANVSNALAAVTGATANPNIRTLFRQVPIRNFSFSFTLIPTSREEANQINSIVKFFREELYPEALTVGGIDYGYRFPNRMLIKLVYRNREIPGTKFLPVYLQSFNAVYNANGMGMHSDGNWSEVQITMNFTETKPLAKQDVERGY